MLFNIVLHELGVLILINDTIVIIKDEKCFCHTVRSLIFGKGKRIKELEVYHQDNEHLYTDEIGQNCGIVSICTAG